MITGNWFVKTYECAGGWCYLGERFCSDIPWHIPITFLLLFIGLVGIIKLWIIFRKGSLLPVEAMNEFNKKIETLEKEVKEAKEIHGLARDVYTTRNLAVLNAKLRAFKEAREMFLGEINKFILTENEILPTP